jgi:acetylglutamate kinase
VEPLLVIKIGGNIIDNEAALLPFLRQFALLDGKKILVHGGGKIATQIGDKLGVESKYSNGRRITDAETIDLVTMVYAGLINKNIVAKLQSIHCNAIGLSGADANCLPATKREVKDIDYGFVGDIINSRINNNFLATLINTENCVPIFCPITHNQQGQLLNTNADTVAQEIALALSSTFNVHLIYIFEKNGVLLDVENENSVIPNITRALFEQLKQPQATTGKPIVFEGMLPKIENALLAVQQGVEKVSIGNAQNLAQLIKGEKGTTITHA